MAVRICARISSKAGGVPGSRRFGGHRRKPRAHRLCYSRNDRDNAQLRHCISSQRCVRVGQVHKVLRTLRLNHLLLPARPLKCRVSLGRIRRLPRSLPRRRLWLCLGRLRLWLLCGHRAFRQNPSRGFRAIVPCATPKTFQHERVDIARRATIRRRYGEAEAGDGCTVVVGAVAFVPDGPPVAASWDMWRRRRLCLLLLDPVTGRQAPTPQPETLTTSTKSKRVRELGNALLLALSLLRLLLLRLQRALIRPHQRAARGFDTCCASIEGQPALFLLGCISPIFAHFSAIFSLFSPSWRKQSRNWHQRTGGRFRNGPKRPQQEWSPPFFRGVSRTRSCRSGMPRWNGGRPAPCRSGPR